MVNPPREEIRRIRAQLQEYGQVGDANVFYWFQNRKSRSKHKNRHFQPSKQPPPPPPPAPSSSSSSSEKSSPGPDKVMALGGGTGGGGVNVVADALNSPTGSSVNNQTAYFTSPAISEPGFMLQVAAAAAAAGPGGPTAFSHGYYLSTSELATMAAMLSPSSESSTATGMGHCTTLLHELMSTGTVQDHFGKKEVDEKMKMAVHHHHQQYGYLTTTTTTTTATTPAVASPSINETQGMLSTSSGVGPATGLRSTTTTTVFINDVAVEVGAAPLNVREAFGDDAVLLHASGQPVLTNEWGVTLHGLQHGASYYLVM
ncbi:hypothetical protein H6P81_012940 [Aristolochia fimbriata]|uniref:Homeobox domain-containing protein n=1 Tax=Aristolochia fimbriata TaxID=158543 RepID=A0AAV7ED97_ARIFI|nr:hypothetical protein H6P81_012940 [Aristolochia fimbriata]